MGRTGLEPKTLKPESHSVYGNGRFPEGAESGALSGETHPDAVSSPDIHSRKNAPHPLGPALTEPTQAPSADRLDLIADLLADLPPEQRREAVKRLSRSDRLAIARRLAGLS